MRTKMIGWVLLLAAAGVSAISAQETLPEPWPVVEQCVPAPRDNDDWSLDGTLLVGQGEIVAVEAESAELVAQYELPRVVGSAGVSPDGLWLAMLVGSANVSANGMVESYTISAIQVHSLTDPELVYTVPWQNTHALGQMGPATTQRRLRWYDNTRLVFEAESAELQTGDAESFVLIDPFQNTSEPYVTAFNPTHMFRFYPSPDWTRVVWNAGSAAADSAAAVWGIYDLEAATEALIAPVTLGDGYTQVAWSADSSRFVAVVDGADGAQSLVVFDASGQQLDVLYTFPPDEYLAFQMPGNAPTLAWSPDGRYVAFSKINVVGVAWLFVADVEQQTVYDLCYPTAEALVWSPNSQQIAVGHVVGLSGGRIDVYDLASQSLHTVLDGALSVVGWRAND